MADICYCCREGSVTAALTTCPSCAYTWHEDCHRRWIRSRGVAYLAAEWQPVLCPAGHPHRAGLKVRARKQRCTWAVACRVDGPRAVWRAFWSVLRDNSWATFLVILKLSFLFAVLSNLSAAMARLMPAISVLVFGWVVPILFLVTTTRALFGALVFCKRTVVIEFG